MSWSQPGEERKDQEYGHPWASSWSPLHGDLSKDQKPQNLSTRVWHAEIPFCPQWPVQKGRQKVQASLFHSKSFLGSWLPWWPHLLKLRNTPALGRVRAAVFSVLISFFFCVNLLNDNLGQVWKQIGQSGPLVFFLPNKPFVCFHFVTQGHLKNGQLSKLQCAEGSPTAPAGRHPFHAWEDPGGCGHVAAEVLCPNMWSLEGFPNGPPWAGMINTNFLPPSGWWSAHKRAGEGKGKMRKTSSLKLMVVSPLLGVPQYPFTPSVLCQ